MTDTPNKPIRAWHFVGPKLRDGGAIPEDGVKLIHPGMPVLCESGLHASLRPWDALNYAPGETLCLVECAGTVLHASDKLVCTERTIVARMDATPLLRYFARQQALSVVHLWEPPQVVLDYLMGDDSAWGAAKDAAWGTAKATAAWAAVWGAARGDAVWAAARAAAWDAVWDTAKAAACEDFDVLVYDSFADWIAPMSQQPKTEREQIRKILMRWRYEGDYMLDQTIEDVRQVVARSLPSGAEPTDRERWNADNPGELAARVFDDERPSGAELPALTELAKQKLAWLEHEAKQKNASAYWYGPDNTAESIDPIGFKLTSAILAASRIDPT